MLLSINPNAIDLLKANQDQIDWNMLSTNAIDLLKANPNKLNWYYLLRNENAIHLLEANQDKINWIRLSKNPCIFELDYNFIKNRMNIIKEELIAKAMHPKRIQLWIDSGIDIENI